MVDTYHHVARPHAFLPSVLRALRPGGRLVIVDFAPGDHIPENVAHPTHRVALETVVRDGREAGFEVATERLWPPYQFIVELRRPE
jgi:SAM-dependent methyltransferase